MKKDYMEACMNATRQRIIQVIMIKKEATSAEIGEELPDIPRASLYRHIKVLLDAEIITVIKVITSFLNHSIMAACQL